MRTSSNYLIRTKLILPFTKLTAFNNGPTIEKLRNVSKSPITALQQQQQKIWPRYQFSTKDIRKKFRWRRCLALKMFQNLWSNATWLFRLIKLDLALSIFDVAGTFFVCYKIAFSSLKYHLHEEVKLTDTNMCTLRCVLHCMLPFTQSLVFHTGSNYSGKMKHFWNV